MRRFVAQSLLFVLPFVLFATFIVWTDPFDYFGLSNSFSIERKRQTAWALNPCFAKLFRYTRNPVRNIVLGDSRIDAFPAAKISAAAGQPYANLAYGGATLNEMIDTFWLADRKTKLSNVVIGLNFSHYSDYNLSYRTDLVPALESNPLLYLTNRTVIKSAYHLTAATLTAKDPKFGAPTVGRDVFWQQVLETLDKWYSKYTKPEKYRRDLAQVAHHCRANGIRLRFVILPEHRDARDLVQRRGLGAEYAAFKQELSWLAETVDYDFEDTITTDRARYKDPVHFDDQTALQIVADVWSSRVSMGRVLRSGREIAPRVSRTGSSRAGRRAS